MCGGDRATASTLGLPQRSAALLQRRVVRGLGAARGKAHPHVRVQPQHGRLAAACPLALQRPDRRPHLQRAQAQASSATAVALMKVG